MSNSGYGDVRARVAAYLQKEQGVPVSADNIVMSCGAAGGLNVVLKTLLNPGEEVIVFAPFFVEYLYYIDNHGGVPVISATNPETFEPDIDALKKAITPRTKAMIINTPKNPTGVIYSRETLEKMAALIGEMEKAFGTTIFVISDEPYTKIVYDGATVPGIFGIFKNSIIVNSFSKSHAVPGERIGYIAVNGSIKDADMLVNGLVFCNRTLGFVNAPAVFQKVIAESLEETVDIGWYKERRDLLYNNLTRLGFSCIKPQGAFYLFPKSPIENDVEFVKSAVKYNLLLVPGSGFGCPGYFRLSYCIDINTIKNSLPAFEKLAREYGLLS